MGDARNESGDLGALAEIGRTGRNGAEPSGLKDRARTPRGHLVSTERDEAAQVERLPDAS